MECYSLCRINENKRGAWRRNGIPEKVGTSDALEFIRGYAEDGYDVIIGHGFEYGDVMKEIARITRTPGS